MKKSYCFWCLLVIAVVSCKSAKRSENIFQLRSEDISGAWFGIDEDFASFSIGKDSIFYPDHGESFSYKLTNDTLVIDYDHGSEPFKVRLIGDTLVFKSNYGGSDTLVRK